MSTILKALRRVEEDSVGARPSGLPEDFLVRPGAPLRRTSARRFWRAATYAAVTLGLVGLFSWWLTRAPSPDAAAEPPMVAAAPESTQAPEAVPQVFRRRAEQVVRREERLLGPRATHPELPIPSPPLGAEREIVPPPVRAERQIARPPTPAEQAMAAAAPEFVFRPDPPPVAERAAPVPPPVAEKAPAPPPVAAPPVARRAPSTPPPGAQRAPITPPAVAQRAPITPPAVAQRAASTPPPVTQRAASTPPPVAQSAPEVEIRVRRTPAAAARSASPAPASPTTAAVREPAPPVSSAPAPPPAPEPPPARVALLELPPPVAVESTRWHPDPTRRTARVSADEEAAVTVREGDRIAGYEVKRIEPTAVLFLKNGRELHRRVGATR